MSASGKLRFAVEDGSEVSALLLLPAEPRLMRVWAHGAGAGMTHPFLESLAAELAAAGVATLRYQFPYMEQRRRVPDPPAVLTATVRAAVHAAPGFAPRLPLIARGNPPARPLTSPSTSDL